MTPRLTTLLGAALIAASLQAPVHAEDSIPAGVARPLRAAQDQIKAGRYKDALASIREAEAASGRSAYETFLIEGLRANAAAAAGDDAAAARAYEAVLATGRAQPAERLRIMESLAASAYRAKGYDKAIEWTQRYFKEGGTSAQMREMELSARYQGGDYAGVVRELKSRTQAAERTGAAIDEQTLRLLASSQLKLGDEAGYAATLEKLVASHPRKEYWADLLARVQNKPGFSDRLALDLFRLRVATVGLDDAGLYEEMAELSLQSGFPAEAQKTLSAGQAAGKLGTGPNAERTKRLQAAAARQAAEDEKSAGADASRNAEGMVNTGFAWVTAGRVEPGIALMAQGLEKGGLKRPDDARLHLGLAYLAARDKAKAIETFQRVQGQDGTADLARLWLIVARQQQP